MALSLVGRPALSPKNSGAPARGAESPPRDGASGVGSEEALPHFSCQERALVMPDLWLLRWVHATAEET